MSLSPRPGPEPPLELATLTGDDRLLDALGRGDPPPADEPAAGLLAAWRADLDDDPPAWSSGDGPDRALAGPVGAAGPARDDRPVPVAPIEPPAVAPPGRRRAGSTRRLLTGIAAATVIVAGLGVGTHRAGPASPLWPVVRMVYPQRADVHTIEQDIEAARGAVAAARYDDARRLLARAESRVDRVRDPGEADRLRDEIARLRATLPVAASAAEPADGGRSPGPAPRGSAASAGPAAPARTGAPSAVTSGRPGPTGSSGANGANSAPPPLLPIPLPSLLAPLLPSSGPLGGIRPGLTGQPPL